MSILGLTLSLSVILNSGVIKDDFLVSIDLPSKCNKNGVFAASTAAGWFAAWVDNRNASADIYGQALSSTLTPLGENTMLNFDSTGVEESMVGVVSDSLGNVIVMWQSNQGSSWDYHLRKMSPSGVPLVKDTLLFSLPQYCYASVAMNAKGEYALVWQDAGYIGIAFFNPDGSRKAEAKEVAKNEPRPGVFPRVAIASNGATIVTWQHLTTIPPDTVARIYARCYNTRCEPRGEVFEVLSATNSIEVKPSVLSLAVGSDHAGRFIISWIMIDASLFQDDVRLYSRSYAWDGSAYGPVKEIAKGVGSSHKMAVAWDGSYSIAWSQDGAYLQSFYADGSARGPLLDIGGGRGEIQDLALRSDQWFAVYSFENDIYCRCGMVQGSMIGSEALLNDDEGSSNQTSPQVFTRDAGDFDVFWDPGGFIAETEFVFTSNNQGRRFTGGGSPVGAEFSIQRGPGSMNPETGEFVKTWFTQFTDSFYYMQRYSSIGQSMGGSVKINPRKLVNSMMANYVNISMNRKGNIVALWSDTDSLGIKRKLFARRFNKDNKPIDAEAIEVAPALTPTSVYSYLDVAMREDNGFIAAFLVLQQQNPTSIYCCYAQIFDKDGNALGEPIKVSENVEVISEARPPSLAVDTSGNFCVTWGTCESGGDRTLYAQCYDASGQKLGGNLNTGIMMGSLVGVGIAARPSGGYVIFGTDYVDGHGNSNVSAYYVNKDGTAVGRKVQINQPDFFPANYQRTGSNSVAATDDRIIYTWLDNRRHKGWDVYAKVTDWDASGISTPLTPENYEPYELEVTNSIGREITLHYSNYAGGFCASVYDASGRKIDKIQSSATSGVVVWGGEHRAPGVYFIVPQQSDPSVTKVVLVK